MPCALVVEDEEHIRSLVRLHLELTGIESDAVADGQAALALVRERAYDVIVLDLMLPGLDGLTLCRAIRLDERNADVPILMLTARREEADKVLGLESGADDYLTKPFGVQELVARVRALLRRPRAGRLVVMGHPHTPVALEKGAAASMEAESLGHPRPVSIHGIDIDPARRRVRIEGRDVDLTANEFDLLYVFATHPGIVFNRDALLRRVWGPDTFVTDRSADALVKRLRRKIEPDAADPRFILTVWGVGYKFADA